MIHNQTLQNYVTFNLCFFYLTVLNILKNNTDMSFPGQNTPELSTIIIQLLLIYILHYILIQL